jgi:hypothetical protein
MKSSPSRVLPTRVVPRTSVWPARSESGIVTGPSESSTPWSAGSPPTGGRGPSGFHHARRPRSRARGWSSPWCSHAVSILLAHRIPPPGLDMAPGLGMARVGEALGVKRGPAEAPSQEEPGRVDRDLRGPQAVVGQAAQVVLEAEDPEALPQPHEREDQETRGRAACHRGCRHPCPGGDAGEPGGRTRDHRRDQLDRRAQERLERIAAPHGPIPSRVMSTG